ncbi:hypothetical protein DIPPA_04722 [Diplonema papillatum]|nr:hypothetical protein DIPPA_04722 [Diplonema papillatum]
MADSVSSRAADNRHAAAREKELVGKLDKAEKVAHHWCTKAAQLEAENKHLQHQVHEHQLLKMRHLEYIAQQEASRSKQLFAMYESEKNRSDALHRQLSVARTSVARESVNGFPGLGVGEGVEPDARIPALATPQTRLPASVKIEEIDGMTELGGDPFFPSAGGAGFNRFDPFLLYEGADRAASLPAAGKKAQSSRSEGSESSPGESAEDEAQADKQRKLASVRRELESLMPKWTAKDERTVASYLVPALVRCGSDKAAQGKAFEKAGKLTAHDSASVLNRFWADPQRMAAAIGNPNAALPPRTSRRWTADELKLSQRISELLRFVKEPELVKLGRVVLSESTGRSLTAAGSKLW